MDLQKNSIDLFLQSVCRFVWDDEKAKDIQDELKDHISSYVEEYMECMNGKRKLHEKMFDRKYGFSALQYFHKELKIEVS